MPAVVGMQSTLDHVFRYIKEIVTVEGTTNFSKNIQ